MNTPPKLHTMLKQLIATPSLSSVNPDFDMGNLAVIELLASWCEDAGFDVEVQGIPGQANKANLIAVKGRGDGGLVLSGHTDTVPFDEALWNSNPFSATEKDNLLYGLGSTDMKSFLGIAIEATKDIAPETLEEPIFIVATADEESSMTGAKALVEAAQPKARYAVIGEPTNLKPIRMHKGVMMEGISITGQSGHSSNPALGNNAMEGMYQVMGELQHFRSELQAKYQNPLFEVPVPTLNFGHICGGDNPNRICGHCEMSIDLRPIPGMDLQELRALLHQRLRHRLKDSGLTLSFTPLFDGAPPFETSASSELVKAAETLSGSAAQAVAFGTEAPYFQQLGMDVIVMGPGNIDVAHQPNEYLPLNQINPCIATIQNLVRRFCVRQD